jgi:shikimate dehydrogenase
MVEIQGSSLLVGILGWPVEHSLSPPMQNAAFAKLGIDFVYAPFPTPPERLAEALAGLVALGVRGANITIPHKETIIPLLDALSSEALEIGAVNVIKIEGGRLLGFNTDAEGFVRAVEETGQTFEGARTALLGAGGAARAMAFGAARAGAGSLTILNRTVAKAEVLAAALKQAYPSVEVRVLGFDDAGAKASVTEAEIVANATSVGMSGQEETPVPAAWLSPSTFVYDTIYNRTTLLLESAQANCCRTLGGATMLVHQGALACEIWTGRKPDTDLMREVLFAQLREQSD